jgi:hypothetical protein
MGRQHLARAHGGAGASLSIAHPNLAGKKQKHILGPLTAPKKDRAIVVVASLTQSGIGQLRAQSLCLRRRRSGGLLALAEIHFAQHRALGPLGGLQGGKGAAIQGRGLLRPHLRKSRQSATEFNLQNSRQRRTDISDRWASWVYEKSLCGVGARRQRKRAISLGQGIPLQEKPGQC